MVDVDHSVAMLELCCAARVLKLCCAARVLVLVAIFDKETLRWGTASAVNIGGINFEFLSERIDQSIDCEFYAEPALGAPPPPPPPLLAAIRACVCLSMAS